MKHTIALAILAMGMGFGFTSHASAQDSAVRVKVPFDFAVGSHVLPQGTYRISADGNFLGFQNAEKKASLYTTTMPGDTSKDGRSVLVFDHVNDKYFLRKIVSTYSRTSADFPKSKLEKNSQETVSSLNIYADPASF